MTDSAKIRQIVEASRARFLRGVLVQATVPGRPPVAVNSVSTPRAKTSFRPLRTPPSQPITKDRT
ncbi:hypothetical protein E0K93_12655 [Puniceibacterium sp. HSS470]|uniref:hypothetical protein n=1 Tax=Pseudooceanicola sediminis TaxID=2211117 RepID=UPI000E676523|nr:hypothetical protein [Pseudooceanicola sediminis]KAA2313947.1 hypothetical protein E0K93_12655 [Puniceibacterium sp. HSS470]